ncbi:DUF4374 domain-containing protein [Autumnicola musiva]|uniref:DUF4374 domain-containing protein n=1 Tax=Autumnicola musiva TaxID=3075589 RepID=A0ABU3D805_9FLAO|nr:DUF4374 domain-containing protein [Zunongwangia sp. F117]MDT0677670.1 DUF4374 domain-containing protein [Zunongwangia sp. F117]
MKKFNLYTLLFISLSLFITSCSDDDNTPNGEAYVEPGPYIITASPQESEGVADYLLTVETLTQGRTTLVGNGIEQDGTYRYYITNNNKFFSLLYGQGDPGAVTTYEMNSSYGLDKLSNFQAETVQSFTNVDDEVLMTRISRNSANPIASWYRLDTESSTIVGEGAINTNELAPGDEQAFFTWMTQVGDKVYAPFMSVKACCNDSFGTEYPDQTWIAVYSYPDMQLEKIIEDDRISFIGRYFRSGLGVVENGDVYAFSSGVATNNTEAVSTNPSAILKINSGETEFDEDYYFNLEEVAEGYYATNQFYVENGMFLVFMEPQESKGAYTDGGRLAIVNVYNETLTWVSGTPEESEIINISVNNYIENGVAHVGITTEEGSYIYNINASSASASRGLKVEAGTITAISKLDPVE